MVPKGGSGVRRDKVILVEAVWVCCFCWWEVEGVSGVKDETEGLGLGPAGVNAPEVDGQVAGHGDDGFFAGGAIGALEYGKPFFDRRVVGLVAVDSPCQFGEGEA